MRRDARQFHDTALDGVHQREVAHRPWEQRALGITGAAQKKRRCGQVDHACHAEFAIHGLQAGNPKTGGFVVLLGLLLVVPFQVFVAIGSRLLSIAMMGLIVQHQNVLQTHQIGHHPVQHLALGFEGVQLFASPLEQRASTLGEIDPLTAFEGVIVGDHDLGTVHVVQQVAGNQFTVLVVAVRIIRLQDPQAILDREAGCYDEKAARVAFALRSPHRVDGLPGDEHRHDGGLAGAGGQLQREAHELRVGVVVGIGQVFKKTFAHLARLGCHFSEPDGSLNRLDLTKERTDAAVCVVPPVLKQSRCLWGYAPVVGVRQASPLVHLLAN